MEELSISLECPFSIAPSVFSSGYLACNCVVLSSNKKGQTSNKIDRRMSSHVLGVSISKIAVLHFGVVRAAI
jgi:hypothetical protein